MQLEPNTRDVMLAQFLDPWRRLGWRQREQTPVALQAAPLLAPQGGQHGVAQR